MSLYVRVSPGVPCTRLVAGRGLSWVTSPLRAMQAHCAPVIKLWLNLQGNTISSLLLSTYHVQGKLGGRTRSILLLPGTAVNGE